MISKPFFGTHTALITPMRDGAVDFSSLQRLVDAQISGGIDGIVATGTTGESPTLATGEHLEVIAKIVEYAGGKVPVMAGTGSNATAEAVALTREADRLGADAILQVAPYYNKPSPEGLFRHFAAVAESTSKPIILYSIPSRCGVEIDVQTCRRLFEAYPHVCGIKEAGGRCQRVMELRQVLPEDYLILSGDDGLTLPFMSLGARGVISVASNLLPAEVSELVQTASAGDYVRAERMNHRLLPLFEALFTEPNPVPVKYLLHRAGIIDCPEVRLPLCPLAEESKALLESVVKKLGRLQ